MTARSQSKSSVSPLTGKLIAVRQNAHIQVSAPRTAQNRNDLPLSIDGSSFPAITLGVSVFIFLSETLVASAYCCYLCRTSSPAAGRQDSGWCETMELIPVGSGDLLAILISVPAPIASFHQPAFLNRGSKHLSDRARSIESVRSAFYRPTCPFERNDQAGRFDAPQEICKLYRHRCSGNSKTKEIAPLVVANTSTP